MKTKRINKSRFANLGEEMVWPIPSLMEDLAWTLKYGVSLASQRDRHAAASVISAYAQLVSLPEKERNEICNALNKLVV